MSLPGISQQPNDPAFVENPYAFYDRARQLGDIVHWQEYGMPCAISHRAVMALLKDRRFARVPPDGWPPEPPHLTEFMRAERHSLLNLASPDHTRLRRFVLQAFTSARVAALRPQIEGLCNDLIDALPDDQPFDMMESYANHVPVIVIARLLGVDPENCDDLLKWSHAMVRMYVPTRTRATEDAANTACHEFLAFLDAAFHARAKSPSDDLISALLRQEAAGGMNRDESLSTCILLLNAGHEATVHALGNAIATLDATGDAYHLTRPDTVVATVEECLRIDPPLHVFTRWAQTTVEIDDVRISKGDQIALLLGAANHDPLVYESPAKFQRDRSGPTLTSFGAGVHFCLGAPLARLELQIALETLYKRMPGLRLARPPHYADIYHFRGFRKLWVTT